MGLWSSADRRRLRRLSGQQGFTLIELLFTIVIISVAFVAVVGGMMTAITASDFHRKAATADTLLRSAGEALVDPQLTYQNCAGSSTYSSVLPSAAGYNVSYSVAYWQSGTFNPASFGSTCGTDAGLQKLTITVTARSIGTTVSESLVVLKRRQ
jgi:prepilin-type N-terminal cleavage/methylation domain-containing protein